MELKHVDIVFQVIVFLFAISVHESAHAWMANRRGDPTAAMLGRISLNPIRHIDPFGTILMPALGLLTGAPVIGWAKPVPVDSRNFKNVVRDDIATSIVGPISNFMIVGIALVLLLALAFSEGGRIAIMSALRFKFMQGFVLQSESVLVPIALLLYEAIFINVLLAMFNLIPLPPLDGSHAIRHLLPEQHHGTFQMVGMMVLLGLIIMRVPFLAPLVNPVLQFVNAILLTGVRALA